MSSALDDAVAALRRSANAYWADLEARPVASGSTTSGSGHSSDEVSLAGDAPSSRVQETQKVSPTSHQPAERVQDLDRETEKVARQSPESSRLPELQTFEKKPSARLDPERGRLQTQEKTLPDSDESKRESGKLIVDTAEPTDNITQADDESSAAPVHSPPPLAPPTEGRAVTVHKTGLIATLRQKLRSLFGDT